MKSRFIFVFVSIYMISGLLSSIKAQDNRVRITGSTLIDNAIALTRLGDCDSVRKAEKLIEGYEALRSINNRFLPDRSLALTQIQTAVGTCNSTGTLAAGGVVCSACTTVEGEPVLTVASVTSGLGTCPQCASMDPLILAVLYMDEAARVDYLSRISPEVAR